MGDIKWGGGVTLTKQKLELREYVKIINLKILAEKGLLLMCINRHEK